MKKWIVLLNLISVATIIAALIHVCFVGDTYVKLTRIYEEDDVKLSSYVIGREGDSVTLTGSRIDSDGELMLSFKSTGYGSTTLNIGLNMTRSDGSTNVRIIRVQFYVLRSGVILDVSGGVTFHGFTAVIYAFFLSILIGCVSLLLIYVASYRRGQFSYLMMGCGGLLIYSFSILAYVFYRFQNDLVRSIKGLFFMITDTAWVFLTVLTPLMMIFAAVLFLSNISLLKHEGRSPINMLGIAFAILWMEGTAATIGLFPWLNPLGNLPFEIRTVFAYIQCYLECMFIATVLTAWLATMYRPKYDRDYIIILGCAIRQDGSLTPILKNRVDRAISFEKAQYEASGKHAVFVPSGGKGEDEVISEGEAMERYLIEQGIPKEQILREDQSENTYQNMLYSRQKIEERSGDIREKKIAFSTTNYHVFRGYTLADKCDFEAKGLSAPTKKYFYFNAFIREFIGLLVNQKARHVISFITITAFFLILERLSWY